MPSASPIRGSCAGRAGLLRRGLASAMVGLFLAGNAGEAAGFHRCPHHDTVAGHAVHSGASHDDTDDAHGCTCFGTCHGSAAVGLPAGPGDDHGPSHATPGDPTWATPAPDARPSSYLHPYANGPPTP